MRSAAMPRFSSKISGFILFSILSHIRGAWDGVQGVHPQILTLKIFCGTIAEQSFHKKFLFGFAIRIWCHPCVGAPPPTPSFGKMAKVLFPAIALTQIPIRTVPGRARR